MQKCEARRSLYTTVAVLCTIAGTVALPYYAFSYSIIFGIISILGLPLYLGVAAGIIAQLRETVNRHQWVRYKSTPRHLVETGEARERKKMSICAKCGKIRYDGWFK